MNILVFEFASGGFAKGNEFGNSILVEGFAMLKLIAEGLKRSGHEVIAVLDARIMKWNPKLKTNRIIEIRPARGSGMPEKLAVLLALIRDHDIDFVFPIAPDDELGKIVKFFESNDIKTISSTSGAIETAADKWKTYKILYAGGICTPKTALFSEMEFPCPYVIKPRSGTSCDDIFLIRKKEELIGRNFRKDSKKAFIIQEFIEGENVSVTLFSDGKTAIPVSLNMQDIELSALNSRYNGGIVSFGHEQKKEAFRIAKSAVECICGLKGCIGVDMIIRGPPHNQAYVIEINPRVTTSMIALELATDPDSFDCPDKFNVSEYAVKSMSGILPKTPEFNKIIKFSRIFADREIKRGEVGQSWESFRWYAQPVSYADRINCGECAGFKIEELSTY